MSGSKERTEKRLRYLEINKRLSELGEVSNKDCIEELETRVDELEAKLKAEQSKAAVRHEFQSSKIVQFEADFKVSKTMYASLKNEKDYWKSMTVDLRKEKSELESKLKASEARNA
jgi:hypothetical protein